MNLFHVGGERGSKVGRGRHAAPGLPENLALFSLGRCAGLTR